MDVWILIAQELDSIDFPSLFLTSKLHSRLAYREDLWRFVFLRRCGPWELKETNTNSWKEAYKKLATAMANIKRVTRSQEGAIGVLIREHLDQFYVRRPDRTTFLIKPLMPFDIDFTVRPGDVVLFSRTDSPELFGIMGNDGEYRYEPPKEYCWPYKSLQYCRIENRVFICAAKTIGRLKVRTDGIGEFICPERTLESLLFGPTDLFRFLMYSQTEDILRLKLEYSNGKEHKVTYW